MIKKYSNSPGMEPNATKRGYQMANERREILDSIHIPFLESTLILCHESEWGSQGGAGREAVIYRQKDNGESEVFYKKTITDQFDRRRDNIALWHKNKLNVQIEVFLLERMNRDIDTDPDDNKKIIFSGWNFYQEVICADIKITLSEKKNHSLFIY